jgi:hypothetical protein
MDEKPVGQEPEFEMIALQIPFAEGDAIYSNASAMALTAMDLRISFAEARQDKTVKAKVAIVMPMEHAALLCLNLFNLLASFERNTGAIRHPIWREYVAKAQAAEARDAAEAAKSA